MSRHHIHLTPEHCRVRAHPARAACLFAVVALATFAYPAADLSASGTGHHPLHTVFVDHFGTSPDPAFTFVNRAGSVTGGRLVIDGGYLPDAQSRDGWAVTHAGDTRWRDYVMTATFDPSNPGGSPPEALMSMFLVRVADASDTAYRVLVWAPGQPDPRLVTPWLDHGLVQVMRVVDGEYTVLKEVERSNTTAGWNRVKVAAVGARITVWVNGSRILSVADPAPIRSGGVGVGQIWETNGVFDDVVVRAVCHR